MGNMKNYKKGVETVNQSNTTDVINEIVNKLEGDDIAKIILALIAAGTVCYVCNKGGVIKINNGDKSICFSSEKNEAA